MEKTVTPIPWRKKPPKHFPCLHCRTGRQASVMVTITGKADQEYNLPLCLICAGLPVNVLVPGLKKV